MSVPETTLDELIHEHNIKGKKAKWLRKFAEGYRNVDSIENPFERFRKKAALKLIGGYAVGGMLPSSQREIADFLELPEDYFTRANLFWTAPLQLLIYGIPSGLVYKVADWAFSGQLEKFTQKGVSWFMIFGVGIWTVRTIYTLTTNKPAFSPSPMGILSELGYRGIKHSEELREAFTKGIAQYGHEDPLVHYPHRA